MSGVYIHIPFCRRICHYCDFHHSASLQGKDAMINAIDSELIMRVGELAAGSVCTLYFGGGTPSVLTFSEVARLIDRVRELWNVSDFEELTFEANPDDLTPEYLAALRLAGVNRLSIGIQSFVDDHLERMNRRHSAADAARAVRDAQRAGFDNLSIDLMYGLPWMDAEQWSANLAQAVSLGVQHISAYHLTIEERTRFGKQGLAPVDEATGELHFEMLRAALLEAGFEHYEVSNFALPGRQARHNGSYWSGEPYLGVGPSAHSYDGVGCRSWNVSSNRLYMEGAVRECEHLTLDERYNESLMTGLRTAAGVSLLRIEEQFGASQREALTHAAAPLIAAQSIVLKGNVIAIPPEKFLTSDYIISRLFI